MQTTEALQSIILEIRQDVARNGRDHPPGPRCSGLPQWTEWKSGQIHPVLGMNNCSNTYIHARVMTDLDHQTVPDKVRTMRSVLAVPGLKDRFS